MSGRRCRSPDRGRRRSPPREDDRYPRPPSRRRDSSREEDERRRRGRERRSPARGARRRSPTPPPPFRLPGPPARRPPPPPPDPRLDFLSPAFDAAAALAAPPGSLTLPVPNAASRDTTEQCRALLPPELPESAAARRAARAAAAAAAAAAAQAKGAADAEAVGGREGLQPAPDLVPKRRPPPVRRGQQAAGAAAGARPPGGALAAIAASAAGVSDPAATGSPGTGPLALLLRLARTPGARARVVTRHARGVRGVAVGTLVSFDRHANLVLADVEEEYSVRVWERRAVGGKDAAGGVGRAMLEGRGQEEDEGRAKTKVRPHLEARARRLRLVFMRGDSVVLVGEAV